MKTKTISVMIAALIATGIASPVASATPTLASASKCFISGPGGGPCPKLGAYYPSPRAVQLPKGSGFTTTMADEVVTDYSPQPPGTVPTAFVVEWTVTAQQNITLTCKQGSHQIVPSDTHMNLYLNGTNLGYVPAYKSTCGDDPNYKVVLTPGKSTNWYVEFHFTPHPGYAISISQFTYTTSIFHPFGSKITLPYRSGGPGSLDLTQATKDLSYVKSLLTNVTNSISNDIDSFKLTTEQWQDLGQLIFKVPSCASSLRAGVVNQDCYDSFTNFLDFTAPPVS